MKNSIFKKTIILFLSFCSFSNTLFSQSVKVYGLVTNVLNNEPIPFANIIIEGTSIGTTSSVRSVALAGAMIFIVIEEVIPVTQMSSNFLPVIRVI